MKNKTRAERRRDTYLKIKERLRKVFSLKYSPKEAFVNGQELGRLRNGAEDNYGKYGIAIKTNTRKGHASYRHKGAYGPENNYNAHDKRQVEAMQQDLDEYTNENLNDV